jgi:hypothetical protein
VLTNFQIAAMNFSMAFGMQYNQIGVCVLSAFRFFQEVMNIYILHIVASILSFDKNNLPLLRAFAFLN